MATRLRIACLTLLALSLVCATARGAEVEQFSITPSAAIAQSNDIAWLLTQVEIAELNQRQDIAIAAIERIEAIEPDNIEATAARARLLLLEDKPQQAKKWLAQLQAQAPDSLATQKVEQLWRLKHGQSAQYNQLQLLTKGGQYDKALEIAERLFAGEFANLSLELDYLSLLAQRRQYWPQVTARLVALNQIYPNVPLLQLQYADMLRRENPLDPKAQKIFSQLVKDPKLGERVGDIWLRTLQDIPMSDSWVQSHAIIASYNPSVLVYQQAYDNAKQSWQQELELRKDPSYRAKLAGIKLINQDASSEQVFQLLTQALSTRPDDPEIIVAMGKYWLRNQEYQKAHKYFVRAKSLDDNPNLQSGYESLITTAQYWWLVEQAEQANEKSQFSQAEQKLQQALALDAEQAYAMIKLAQLYMSQSRWQLAQAQLQKAIATEPDSGYALSTQLEWVVRTKGEAAGLKYIASLSPSQQRLLQEPKQQLQQRQLMDDLAAAQAKGDTALIEQRVAELLKTPPQSPWQKREIAQAMVQIGEQALAKEQMRLWSLQDSSPEMQYAYALFLNQQQQPQQALIILEQVPLNKRSEAMNGSLLVWQQAAKAQQITLAFAQNPQQGERLLHQWAEDMPLFVAKQWLNIERSDIAQEMFSAFEIKTIAPWQVDDYLDLARAFADTARLQQLSDWVSIQNWPEQNVILTKINRADRLMRVQQALQNNELSAARDILKPLTLEAEPSQSPWPELFELAVMQYQTGETAWEYDYLFLQRGRLASYQFAQLIAMSQDDQQQALLSEFNVLTQTQAYDWWLVHDALMQQAQWSQAQEYGLQALQRHHFEQFQQHVSPQQSYLSAGDDWMSNSLVRNIDQLRHRKQSYLKVGADFSFEQSDSRNFALPVEASIAMPEYDGHLLLRTELIHTYDENTYFGTEQEVNIKQTGQAFAIGWQADTWQVDLGTTPVGFNQTDWVGGVTLDVDLQDFGLSVDLSKRPETSSSLAYAGAKVDVDQQRLNWGSVLRSGASLGLSWDQGGDVGFWSVAQWHQLKGHNVEDNQRYALMAGTYYKWINQSQQRLNIGLNLFHMGYDKNLSEFVYGHGDYYSPQAYTSLAIPLSYYQQVNNQTSIGLLASVSHSWTQTDAPYGVPGESSRDKGFGFGFEGLVEHKLSPHWSVGGKVALKVSDDYQPNQIQLYFKYYFNDNWRQPPLQPSTLQLYSNFY
ncbi:cellulose synthase subunit BcsC-related outer membrane protein [Motilimonas pumila]|uniref:Cellulose synthase operon C C-terminal domain-containing protein n=1 Tax=Motilimonas pumila TaxID=2303987 RepID=A0A418YFT7_9GAMM|nr:cellulose synthase subunit BcsC-related outer membrane protein [Motilimonas pumila]RJG48405.1 hypothetical protein D1Z90_07890 [Motilimonas pumila]